MRNIIIVTAAIAAMLGPPIGCADDDSGTSCGDGYCGGTETCGTCPVDCGPCTRCGDRACNGGENCATCPSDCGCSSGQVCSAGTCVTSTTCATTCDGCCSTGDVCLPGDSINGCGIDGDVCQRCAATEDCIFGGCIAVGRCTTNADCGGTEICVAGSCESPWGRIYRVYPSSGVFPERMSDGSCWDDWPCGLPDPYVNWTIDSTTRETGYVDGTTTPDWGSAIYMDVPIYAYSTFTYTVWDYDTATGNEYMLGLGAPVAVDASWLRDGFAVGHTDDWTYSVNFMFELR